MKKKVLGIAGYIGSGKTTVGNYFSECGAYFIEADEIVNQLYEPNADGWLKIMNYFGQQFVTKDGHINRAKLSKFVFENKNKLKILNVLIHPLVANEVQKAIDKCQKPIIVVEASYFEKKHLLRLVDSILWIDCDKEILKKRVLASKNLTEYTFKQILGSQSEPEQIDYRIANNGTKAELYKALKSFWQTYLFIHKRFGGG